MDTGKIIVLSLLFTSCVVYIPAPNSGGNSFDLPTLSQAEYSQYAPLPSMSLLLEEERVRIMNQVMSIPNSKQLDDITSRIGSVAFTDVEKAWAVYCWIALNIRYDAQAYYANRYFNVAPKTTLERGEAVCGGYARLVAEMLRALSVPVFEISGYARGVGGSVGDKFSQNHAWNAVEIDGRYYLMDATWGSGSMNTETRSFSPEFTPFYFFPPPKRLLSSHFPKLPSQQLVEQPISFQEFMKRPHYYGRFYETGLQAMKPIVMNQQTDGRLKLTFRNPNNLPTLISAKEESSSKTYSGMVFRRDGESTYLLHFPRKGSYQVTLFTAEGESYSSALSWMVRTTVEQPILPETYASFQENHCELISPLRAELDPRKNYDFIIRVPMAIKVAAHVGGKWHYFEESEDGMFRKQLKGNAYGVYAQFDEGSSWTGLLAYKFSEM